MKRIAYGLKKLAERRARVASQLASSKLANEILEKELSELKDRLNSVEKYLNRSVKDLARLSKNLAEVDAAIFKVSPTTDPEAIAPIEGWKGKYGDRGALKQFVLTTFKSHEPKYLLASVVAELAITNFSLVFATQKESAQFRYRGVKGTIQVLTTKGILERGEDVLIKGQRCGQWRWKTEVMPTLASLSKQSEAISAVDH